MKFAAARPYADREAAARKLVDIILDAVFARIALPFREAWPRASHEAPASEVTSR